MWTLPWTCLLRCPRPLLRKTILINLQIQRLTHNCSVSPCIVAAGKKWVDAAVDLPFALPTSVAGLTLATVYSDDGMLGYFLTRMGIDVVFTKLGVAVAMVFVSFPFVVRTMQPVLQVRFRGCSPVF